MMTGFMNWAANLVAVVHIGYFLFILGGLIAILVGTKKNYRWVRNPWFRITHFVAVYIVLFEEVTGLPCILNLMQWALRSSATGESEATSGTGGILDYLLYQTISPLMLDIFYWSTGLALLILLWKVPPRFRKHSSPK